MDWATDFSAHAPAGFEATKYRWVTVGKKWEIGWRLPLSSTYFRLFCFSYGHLLYDSTERHSSW